MHIYILITYAEALAFPRVVILAPKVMLMNNININE